MKLVTSTLRLTLYLILFSTTSTYAGVLGISDVEVEKALKGTGSDQVYIRIFDGIVPIPNVYAFEAGPVKTAAIFKGVDGAVSVGAYSDLPNDFSGWINERTLTEIEYCGLNVKRQVTGDVESVLVHDENQYLFFASTAKNVWKAALKTYCSSKNGKEK